jgi:hypothetical protein
LEGMLLTSKTARRTTARFQQIQLGTAPRRFLRVVS